MTAKRGRPSACPFETLTKLGDNFFIPAETPKEKRVAMRKVSQAASGWCRRRGIAPNPFATDREYGGVRCTFLEGDALTIRVLARGRIARKHRRRLA